MKLLTIIGARPQFIEAATVSRAIRAHNAQVQATGQGQPIDGPWRNSSNTWTSSTSTPTWTTMNASSTPNSTRKRITP